MADLILAPVKPCIKCGACERDKRGNCKLCIKARVSAWRLANRDKVKATASAWLAANADKAKATFVAWRSANIDRIRAQTAAWTAANKEKTKAYSAEWSAANFSRRKATSALWVAANPEKRRVYMQNRRARKSAVGGKLSVGLAEKLFRLQKGKCPCCGLQLGDNYHMDHKMPLALGGEHADDNMQLLTASCNLKKHTAHPVDFMQSRGFLL